MIARRINIAPWWSKVLKSTGSAFTKFHRDEYTTLVEVDDRIFSTSIDLSYTFSNISISAPTDEKKLEFIVPFQKGEVGYNGSVWDEDVPSRARTATLETFAVDESASVQVHFLWLFLESFCADLEIRIVGNTV